MHRWRRGLLGPVVLLSLAASILSASAGACPGPYCPKYEFFSPDDAAASRWPASRDGLIRIPYWVNPTQPFMTEADATGAVRAAAATWMRANPRLRLIYEGTTRDPAIPGDRKLVISWTPPSPFAAMTVGKPGDYDIYMSLHNPWFWSPCSTSCPPVRAKSLDPIGSGPLIFYHEVQGVLTHELGHVVGLGDLADEDTVGLTMNAGCGQEVPYGYVPRCLSSLGLGDILGAKALYPWKCPALKRGVPRIRRNYPTPYRQLCPTIQIFVP